MNYLQIDKCSIENGLGIRVSLWVSGCSVHCPGCHNPETWDFNAGRPFDSIAKTKLFELLDKPWVKGITLTGGHPIEIPNQWDVITLLTEIRDKFPSKDIWLYTGHTLQYKDFTSEYPWSLSPLLRLCDVVVDGPYIEDQRDITLAFKGSKNQRLIDVKKSLETGRIEELHIE